MSHHARSLADVSDLRLPLDLGLDDPVPVRCWYCGTGRGPWEREHQLPVSRGGAGGDNVVRACEACNHLKGKLTLEEFRDALALRLTLPTVTFAGEATGEHPATSIRRVRSLAATQEVTRLDPVVGERLDRCLVWLRRRGRRMTRKDAVSAAVTAWLDGIAENELDGKDFPPSDDVLPFEGFDLPPVISPDTASKTPRQVWERDVTRIDAAVLEHVRLAVEVIARHEAPITLMDFVTLAVIDRLDAVKKRYPDFAEWSRSFPQAEDPSSALGTTAMGPPEP
jgi:hypothetical protein